MSLELEGNVTNEDQLDAVINVEEKLKQQCKNIG